VGTNKGKSVPTQAWTGP